MGVLVFFFGEEPMPDESTWEGRMAVRARVRAVVAEAEAIAGQDAES